MPLVKPHRLYRRAFREGWALGAFNTSNLEVTQAIAWALAEAAAPGIIQTSERAIQYAGLIPLRDIVRDVAAAVPVPVILHLDHGRSWESARRCIDAGYRSVMIDGSRLPEEENTALTKRVVDYAHRRNVWVEGELGAVPGSEGRRGGRWKPEKAQLTDPDAARRFVERTGVDALAVAVGTLHGAFRGEEGIRWERLRSLRQAVPAPLVLHGGSGVADDDLRRVASLGVAKVNIDTELREAFHSQLAAHQEDEPQHRLDPRALLSPAREAVQRVVAQKVALLGSQGKAGAFG